MICIIKIKEIIKKHVFRLNQIISESVINNYFFLLAVQHRMSAKYIDSLFGDSILVLKILT